MMLTATRKRSSCAARLFEVEIEEDADGRAQIKWTKVEPRRIFDELSELRLIDVVLPTRTGFEIRKRCVTKPSAHQQILRQHLGTHLSDSLRTIKM